MKVQKIFYLSKSKSAFLLLFLISLLIPQWTNPIFASPANRSESEPRRVPSSLLKWPKKTSDYAILVDKSAQKVFVYHRNNPFTPIKVYRSSTGENDGPKSAINDKKPLKASISLPIPMQKGTSLPYMGPGPFPLIIPARWTRRMEGTAMEYGFMGPIRP